MHIPFEGGCHCGAVRYSCTAMPQAVLLCHCRDCQRTTGGPFATVAVVPLPALDVVGAVQSYVVTAESGRTVTRQFCPQCGSPLFERAEGYPDIVLFKVGSADDPSWIEPTQHVWTCRALPWPKLVDTLPRYPRNPPL